MAHTDQVCFIQWMLNIFNIPVFFSINSIPQMNANNFDGNPVNDKTLINCEMQSNVFRDAI